MNAQECVPFLRSLTVDVSVSAEPLVLEVFHQILTHVNAGYALILLGKSVSTLSGK